ncbi:ribonuclease E/G [Pacificispira sp.]|uniref:ribonuclease E/G n=1 Tax=Pacificispira sp. TaxID=2888761 RepID=UPI003B52B447
MSGAAEIYIEGSPAERRAGHLDADGRAVAIDIDRATRQRLIGAVYLARVRSVDKRMGGAFLDLGIGPQVLLAKAREVEEGDTLLVQVARDAHDDKGPAVVRQIVLWGRYVALQPGRGGGLQCARSLGQGKRRAEALAAAESAIQDPTDLILRGPAASVPGEVLAEEAARLRALWSDLQSRKSAAKAPALLMEAPGFVDFCLREAGPDARVALDDRLDFAAAEALVRERYPDLAEGLAFHQSTTPIFDAAGLSDILEEALGTEVPLTGGGRVTIQETKALTAIDVDMGSGEAGATMKDEALHRLNRRAADEIARQILLRRISGLIVIDFAGVKQRGKMKALLDMLRSRLKGGEGHADVLGISAAGLVEITRQRIGPSLAQLCVSPVQALKSAPDAEAADILRRALRLKGAGKPVADLSEAAAALFKGPLKPALAETERRLGQPLTLRPGAPRPDVRMEA